MIQTLALFHAAYRELNARKLFWITMVISGLLVVAFAIVGINKTGLTVLWWEFEIPMLNSRVLPPDVFYKQIFAYAGVPYWLAWLATILALVSTSSIVPDMVSGGSIDILLSKPIGRTRLFLTRYCTGLLFVIVQVTVFTLGCFLVIGIRGGAWEPWILIAIPLVVLFFSYLFSMCALVGLLTRSTIASLLVTILFWLFIFGANSAESVTLIGRTSAQMSLEYAQEEFEIAEEDGDPTMIPEVEKNLAEAQDAFDTWDTVYQWFYWTKVILPKTNETIGLLERMLRQNAGMDIEATEEDENIRVFGPTRISRREFEQRVQDEIDSRSVTWVLGTSLLFEAFILSFACWRFSRRDF
jgi:ABC-type transport system involved in multi-copper enzyme maturation permease subunit